MNKFIVTLAVVIGLGGFMPTAGADAGDRTLKGLNVRQNIGQTLPADVELVDEQAHPVRLGEFYKGKPVLMTFIYFSCPMLCPLNIKGLAESLKRIDEQPGRDYELLVVSFDPDDRPADALKRRHMLARMIGGPGGDAGIHFLTGTDAAIRRLTEAAGFPFQKDPATGQFAHPAALIVASPQGRISRYLFGLDHTPRDLRLALADAAKGQSGTLADAVALFCFAYNPSTGRYSLAVLNLLKLAGVITLLVLGGVIILLKRQEAA